MNLSFFSLKLSNHHLVLQIHNLPSAHEFNLYFLGYFIVFKMGILFRYLRPLFQDIGCAPFLSYNLVDLSCNLARLLRLRSNFSFTYPVSFNSRTNIKAMLL